MDNNLPALERAITTLELLGQHPRGLSAGDLGEHTAIPRATLYRILRMLRERDFVASAADGSNRLVLGPALARLAALAPRPRDLVATVQPLMDALSEQVGETVKLVVREQLQAVTVAVAYPRGDSRISSRIGTRLPLYVGASQRLLLAVAPAEVRQAVLAAPLVRHASRTVARVDLLRRDLDTLRRRGWATGHSEGVEGVGAVAALVQGPAEEALAALVTVYIHGGKTVEQRREILHSTLDVAGRASELMGHAPAQQPAPQSRKAA